MNRIIAFDEAGYTGQDLNNKEQPVFTYSSVNFTKEETNELKSFISTKAGEIKFNKLKKYSKFEKELEKVLNHELINENTVRIAIAHKEYMIIAQTVDKLIEPLTHRDGFDLYEQGENLALTNMLYYCMPPFCGEELVNNYYEAFVKMIRNKTVADIKDYYNIVAKLIESSTSEDFKSTLSVILYSADIIEDILEEADKFYMDVTTASLTVLCDYWGNKLGDVFDVIADNSKPLESSLWILEKIKSSDIEPKIFGYGGVLLS
ncbi:MAG: hypothetical protein LBU84_01035 [Prevotella sp.]|jgi:predicted SprT family Zn-dependent metalloprotease|nr:hypothetical protein [Prevotella sp.]